MNAKQQHYALGLNVYGRGNRRNGHLRRRRCSHGRKAARSVSLCQIGELVHRHLLLSDLCVREDVNRGQIGHHVNCRNDSRVRIALSVTMQFDANICREYNQIAELNGNVVRGDH